jgi:hypothetical protein
MGRYYQLFLGLTVIICCKAHLHEQRELPQVPRVEAIGTTISNFPNIYRDGGGGGKINGLNLMIFSDGIYTSGGLPGSDNSNWVNFTSNSIAASNYDGGGPQSLSDFGTISKGPKQQIPYYYNDGEDDFVTGIWPNQGITTLCDGLCGVSFPEVVNRTAIAAGLDSAGRLYNTPVQISLTAYGPVVTRPKQKLFTRHEPLFGTFGTLAGVDGYLYLFASITHTSKSNGLKMARVPQSSWFDRSRFEYWDGSSWTSHIPPYDDDGAANILNYSQEFYGTLYGPGTGDLFFSSYLKMYVLLFQADNAAIDNHGMSVFLSKYRPLMQVSLLTLVLHVVYVSYSTQLESGWSTPRAIYEIDVLPGGYSYSFHAYPNYESSGRVIPLSWSEWSPPSTYFIAMANLTFM